MNQNRERFAVRKRVPLPPMAMTLSHSVSLCTRRISSRSASLIGSFRILVMRSACWNASNMRLIRSGCSGWPEMQTWLIIRESYTYPTWKSCGLGCFGGSDEARRSVYAARRLRVADNADSKERRLFSRFEECAALLVDVVDVLHGDLIGRPALGTGIPIRNRSAMVAAV